MKTKKKQHWSKTNSSEDILKAVVKALDKIKKESKIKKSKKKLKPK